MNHMFGKILVILLLATSTTSYASPTSNYFRVFQGFKRSDISSEDLLNKLPSFMKDTVDLYGEYQALNNYIVVIPPKNKPAYIPDELALVGLESEEIYREIRQTPKGMAYSERHWEIFNKDTSASAKIFIDYTKENPQELIHNAAYDMFGDKIDWSSGYNLVYIGLRKDNLDSKEFLALLKNHIELAKNTMGPKGLKGYIVLSNEKFEVAYLNWESKEAFDKANTEDDAKLVFEDAAKFMNTLMFEEAKAHSAGAPIDFNSNYSNINN